MQTVLIMLCYDSIESWRSENIIACKNTEILSFDIQRLVLKLSCLLSMVFQVIFLSISLKTVIITVEIIIPSSSVFVCVLLYVNNTCRAFSRELA